MMNGFKLFVAIDFGTVGCAISYCLPNGSVYVQDEWTNHGANTKMKSRVLMDKYGQRVAFGEDASFMYFNHEDLKQEREWMLFERFKMNLYETKRTKKSTKIKWDDADDFDEEEKLDKPQKQPLTLRPRRRRRETANLRKHLSADNGALYESEKVFVCCFKFLKEEVCSVCSKHLSECTFLKNDKNNDTVIRFCII